MRSFSSLCRCPDTILNSANGSPNDFPVLQLHTGCLRTVEAGNGFNMRNIILSQEDENDSLFLSIKGILRNVMQILLL